MGIYLGNIDTGIPVSNFEYQVYSSVLRGDQQKTGEKTQVVDAWAAPPPRKRKGIPMPMLDSAWYKSRRRFTFQPSYLNSTVPVRVLTDSYKKQLEKAGPAGKPEFWKNFLVSFPGAKGIHHFSRVGFNHPYTPTAAMLEHVFVTPERGTGQIQFLRLAGPGIWALGKDIETFDKPN